MKDNEAIPVKLLMPASAIVALINTTIIMPLDCVKTHLEKVNPSSTYIGAFKQIYLQSGNQYSGFFTGVRLRFLLHFSNAIFTVNILEILKIT